MLDLFFERHQKLFETLLVNLMTTDRLGCSGARILFSQSGERGRVFKAERQGEMEGGNRQVSNVMLESDACTRPWGCEFVPQT